MKVTKRTMSLKKAITLHRRLTHKGWLFEKQAVKESPITHGYIYLAYNLPYGGVMSITWKVGDIAIAKANIIVVQN